MAKNKLVPGGRQVYVVPTGLYRGIKLELDLRHNFQTYVGLWELETHRYLNQWSDYEWAIDVGAGIGELCLFLLKRKPKIQKIFAVDADADEVRHMKLNFQLNPHLDTSKVTIVERRVGAGTERDELRLDELELPPQSTPGLIKIDVDGYEMEVLKGADKILQRRAVDLLIETHTASLERQSIEFLKKFGFMTHVIMNGWYRAFFPEQRPSEHNRWLWASNR